MIIEKRVANERRKPQYVKPDLRQVEVSSLLENGRGARADNMSPFSS